MHVVRRISVLCFTICFFILHGSAGISERDTASTLIAYQVQRDLGRQLSPMAKIFVRNSAAFVNAVSRWSAAQNPDFAVVVLPDTDEDVAIAVLGYPIAIFLHQILTDRCR